MTRRFVPQARYRSMATVAAILLLSSGCSKVQAISPNRDPETPKATVPQTTQPKATTTTIQDVSLGKAGEPFAPLPEWDKPSALITSGGVVVPVKQELEDHYEVHTPCGAPTQVSSGTEIGRAHVVLDAGHGGTEVGAAGASGAVEKDLNLTVVRETKTMLERMGATVVLTRNGDYTLTTKMRAEITNKVKPALFVSVHHNGGAPAGGTDPGTIVFTKSGNEEAKRFGGLFYQELQPFLASAAAPKIAEWQEYDARRQKYEAELKVYQDSVLARDAAIEENRIRIEIAQAQQPTDTPPGSGSDISRQPVPPELVPVPELAPVPEPFTMAEVIPFSWAGTGNAGVRAWAKPNGEDYLAVLRESDDTPSALAEFLYVTNPAEEQLLLDPTFVQGEAKVLADAIVKYFSTSEEGTGFVKDQTGDQDIGGGGHASTCDETPLEA